MSEIRPVLISMLVTTMAWPLTAGAQIIGEIRDEPAGPRGRATQRAMPRPNQPDPSLFDGSSEEPEQRPDQGMLADFEMPGDVEQSERIGQTASEEGGPQGSAEEPSSSGSGGPPPEATDPNAKAEGIEVANLEIPEGAEPVPQSAGPEKPKEISLGDATMQIQTAPQSADGGGQAAPSNSDQLQKGSAKGNQSSDNRNRGVERGRAIPSGL